MHCLSSSDLGALPSYFGNANTKQIEVRAEDPMSGRVTTRAGDVPQYGGTRPAPMRTVRDEANFAGLGDLGALLDKPVMVAGVAAAAVLVWYMMKRK